MPVHKANKYTYLPCDHRHISAGGKLLIDLLTPHIRKFDSIVFAGNSGAMIAGILSLVLKKNTLAVKGGNHSKYYYLQGYIGKRYIIVDDFIGHGSTMRRIFKQVKAIKGVPFEPRCVGIFLYGVEISAYKDEWEGIPINRFKICGGG